MRKAFDDKKREWAKKAGARRLARPWPRALEIAKGCSRGLYRTNCRESFALSQCPTAGDSVYLLASASDSDADGTVHFVFRDPDASGNDKYLVYLAQSVAPPAQKPGSATKPSALI